MLRACERIASHRERPGRRRPAGGRRLACREGPTLRQDRSAVSGPERSRARGALLVTQVAVAGATGRRRPRTGRVCTGFAAIGRYGLAGEVAARVEAIGITLAPAAAPRRVVCEVLWIAVFGRPALRPAGAVASPLVVRTLAL